MRGLVLTCTQGSICLNPTVEYKMAALMFKTMSSSMPAYLNDLIQTAVPVRPLRSSDAPLLIVPKRELSTRVGLFRSRLRTLETHYHPTLDPAVLRTPSNDTSRPIFSDSLNLTPPAPLYLRTLWRYTNAVIIIIIINAAESCVLVLTCCIVTVIPC